MKRFFTGVLMSLPLSTALLAQTPAQPPVASKISHVTTIHGRTLKDDYFWLREKKNPEVLKYLEAENAYTEEVMKPTDRKSTRLNSSHTVISYAVFCLKKKSERRIATRTDRKSRTCLARGRRQS